MFDARFLEAKGIQDADSILNKKYFNELIGTFTVNNLSIHIQGILFHRFR